MRGFCPRDWRPSADAKRNEVPTGVDGSRGSAGARIRSPDLEVARDLGVHPEALRKRVRRAGVDAGKREGVTSEEREEIRKLRREVFELRRANEILKSASVFFAKELDPDRPK